MRETRVIVTGSPKDAQAARAGARRRRWWSDVGGKYILAVVVLFFAAFPLVYVLSASLNPNGSLAASSALFSAFDPANYIALGESRYWV
ncbi:sugar ABC transporter permease, partial [Pseudomonas sp. BGM005]|nr:sugar ABC transporter permease [Pseudomonas sp. BG5]